MNRKNIITILMSVELILLAVNINFVAFSAFLNDLVGQIFALFVLTVAAACKSEGRTVLFSTHHMDEVDQLCDSVVIIHEGKLCFEGSVDAMRSQTGETFLDKAFLKLIKPKTEETTQ